MKTLAKKLNVGIALLSFAIATAPSLWAHSHIEVPLLDIGFNRAENSDTYAFPTAPDNTEVNGSNGVSSGANAVETEDTIYYMEKTTIKVINNDNNESYNVKSNRFFQVTGEGNAIENSGAFNRSLEDNEINIIITDFSTGMQTNFYYRMSVDGEKVLNVSGDGNNVHEGLTDNVIEFIQRAASTTSQPEDIGEVGPDIFCNVNGTVEKPSTDFLQVVGLGPTNSVNRPSPSLLFKWGELGDGECLL